MPERVRYRPSADQILESSEKLFAKHGYEAVALRRLIAASKVSTTAFYARFKSKDDVLVALTWGLLSELHEGAPAALATTRDLASGIDAGIDFMCDRLENRKALVRLILSETGSSKAAIDVKLRAYTLLQTFLAMRFAMLAEKRKLTAEDPAALAWAVIGALEMQVTRWAVWGAIDASAMRDELKAAARVILRMGAR